MPDRAATTRPPAEDGAAVRFRRPSAELVQRAARRLVRGGRASFPSLAAFRSAVLVAIRRDEPLATVGGVRLRRLLIDAPGVRLSVRYREAPGAAPPSACPVCGSPLREVHNRTLTGDRVVIGRRCTRCEYWTHARRRVPVRYTFTKAGIDGRPVDRSR